MSEEKKPTAYERQQALQMAIGIWCASNKEPDDARIDNIIWTADMFADFISGRFENVVDAQEETKQ